MTNPFETRITEIETRAEAIDRKIRELNANPYGDETAQHLEIMAWLSETNHDLASLLKNMGELEQRVGDLMPGLNI